MINFYTILGVQQGASLSEIKAGFRKLAMIYHPDKNPGGKDEFTRILRAYETLADPAKRRAYDLKLKYHTQTPQREHKSKGNNKNWSFDEKELKRRRYYDEHIKKYEKHTGKDPRVNPVKNNYNEYKYILFATPLAVALFLMIVNLSTGSQAPRHNQVYAAGMDESSQLKMGAVPYADHFGRGNYDLKSDRNLTIKNRSGSGIIVCLFSEKNFVRSCFIEDGFYAEIPQLTKKAIEIRYVTGKDWAADSLIQGTETHGMFRKEVKYYTSKESDQSNASELSIVSGMNEGFREVDMSNFFSKE